MSTDSVFILPSQYSDITIVEGSFYPMSDHSINSFYSSPLSEESDKHSGEEDDSSFKRPRAKRNTLHIEGMDNLSLAERRKALGRESERRRRVGVQYQFKRLEGKLPQGCARIMTKETILACAVSYIEELESRILDLENKKLKTLYPFSIHIFIHTMDLNGTDEILKWNKENLGLIDINNPHFFVAKWLHEFIILEVTEVMNPIYAAFENWENNPLYNFIWNFTWAFNNYVLILVLIFGLAGFELPSIVCSIYIILWVSLLIWAKFKGSSPSLLKFISRWFGLLILFQFGVFGHMFYSVSLKNTNVRPTSSMDLIEQNVSNVDRQEK